jgi:hypothetical protein
MTLSSWWDRFRKSGASATSPRGAETSAQGDGASPDAQDPLGRVRWVPATENPFGVDVLDCSAFAESMVSASSSPEVAKRFMELRASDGEHCRGKDPTIAASARCLLTYPSSAHAQSALFRAAEMEEKWDVFLLDGDLNFARSWTGELVYRASMTFEPSRTIVSEIFGVREPGSENPVAVVDYLIKSHVFGLVAPHPLPPAPQAKVKDLALWSFARYGRRGLFGTHADVTHFAVRRDDDGRCRLKL